MKRHIAILLAGGSGSRMQSTVPKQYINIHGKPVLYFSLKALEESFIDEIILVCRPSDEEYCKQEIVDRYGFTKVTGIVPGGSERYASVYNGLKKVAGLYENCQDSTYIYVHDGARACIDQELLLECKSSVEQYNACVPAVPVKDTIKVIDSEGFSISTPNRSTLMAVQTPQCFRMDIVWPSYIRMDEEHYTGATDDASVVERFSDTRIKLCKGSYNNIKITTAEDISIAENILV